METRGLWEFHLNRRWNGISLAPRLGKSEDITVMPISSVVNKTLGQIRTTVTGRVTVKEILDHLSVAQSEGLLSFSELIDASEPGLPYLSVDEIWNAAGAVRATKFTEPPGPRAVVVSSPTTFGLVRIFTTLLSGHFPIDVFRSEAAALDWLSSHSRVQSPVPPPSAGGPPS